jgi:hypothetical protein
LWYMHARWYDPVVGQFTSADSANDGSNRFGYVHGNPSTLSDPTGHISIPTSAGSVGGGKVPQSAGSGVTSSPVKTKTGGSVTASNNQSGPSANCNPLDPNGINLFCNPPWAAPPARQSDSYCPNVCYSNPGEGLISEFGVETGYTQITGSAEDVLTAFEALEKNMNAHYSAFQNAYNFFMGGSAGIGGLTSIAKKVAEWITNAGGLIAFAATVISAYIGHQLSEEYQYAARKISAVIANLKYLPASAMVSVKEVNARYTDFANNSASKILFFWNEDIPPGFVKIGDFSVDIL